MRNGKLMTTAKGMVSKATKNRSGPGVKRVSSRRVSKGEQRFMAAGRVLKGPTPAS